MQTYLINSSIIAGKIIDSKKILKFCLTTSCLQLLLILCYNVTVTHYLMLPCSMILFHSDSMRVTSKRLAQWIIASYIPKGWTGKQNLHTTINSHNNIILIVFYK